MPLRWQDGSGHKMQCNNALYLLVAVLVALANAMTPKRTGELRQEAVAMFYHGFDNYMKIAFPEDEVPLPRHNIQLMSLILTSFRSSGRSPVFL